MSDLGNDVGQASLNAAVKSTEKLLELLKYLLEQWEKDYNKELVKSEFKQKKHEEKLNKSAGYVKLKSLQESKASLTYTKAEMSEEQKNKFLKLSAQRGIPVSFIHNGKDDNGKKTYLGVFMTKHSNIVEDVTEQLIRDTKIAKIENTMKETLHYKKKSFENAIKSVDGKLIDNPVIICERTNPNNFIKVTGIQEHYTDGRPYIASIYDVYKEGKKQKSNEFKHGEFRHNCDKMGRNSSDAGEEHWENIKSEMKEKCEFTDDILVFSDEKEYKAYVEEFMNDRTSAEKSSNFYDELNNEKNKVIKTDIDNFNERKNKGIFEDISNAAKNNSLTFADTLDHFQVEDGEKEQPYIICNRTTPDNYIEVAIEQSKDYKGNLYNQHTYNIYVDDKKIINPHREDGSFTDERFEDRPISYWKDLKIQMKEAGKFGDDCVVFVNKEDYLKYRQIYQQEHNNLKDPSIHFETNKDGIRSDFGYIHNYLESCKSEMNNYSDIGSIEGNNFILKTKEDGTLDGKIFAENRERISEAIVISEQINNYQNMTIIANELVKEKSNLEALENSDLKNSDVYENIKNDVIIKINEKELNMKKLQDMEVKLWEQREQISGIKSEFQLRKEEISEAKEHKQVFTNEELKNFADTFKQNKLNSNIIKDKEIIRDKGDR